MTIFVAKIRREIYVIAKFRESDDKVNFRRGKLCLLGGRKIGGIRHCIFRVSKQRKD